MIHSNIVYSPEAYFTVTSVLGTLILLFQLCSGQQWEVSHIDLADGIAIVFIIAHIMMATVGSLEEFPVSLLCVPFVIRWSQSKNH
jgi:hypothetical protein